MSNRCLCNLETNLNRQYTLESTMNAVGHGRLSKEPAYLPLYLSLLPEIVVFCPGQSVATNAAGGHCRLINAEGVASILAQQSVTTESPVVSFLKTISIGIYLSVFLPLLTNSNGAFLNSIGDCPPLLAKLVN